MGRGSQRQRDVQTGNTQKPAMSRHYSSLNPWRLVRVIRFIYLVQTKLVVFNREGDKCHHRSLDSCSSHNQRRASILMHFTKEMRVDRTGKTKGVTQSDEDDKSSQKPLHDLNAIIPSSYTDSRRHDKSTTKVLD